MAGDYPVRPEAPSWCEERESGTVDWEYLYEQYADSLRRLIARRLPRGAPVEDVLQETFARGIRSTRLIDTRRPPWPFLATVAGRAVADWWSREGAHRALGGPTREATDDFPGSDEHASALDRVIGTRRALLALKPRHRRALYLHAGADCSYQRLVELDRISSQAMRSLVCRARARFEAHYRDLALGLLVWGRTVSARIRARLERLAVPLAGDGLAALGGVMVASVVVGAATFPSASATAPARSARPQPAVVLRPGGPVLTSESTTRSPTVAGRARWAHADGEREQRQDTVQPPSVPGRPTVPVDAGGGVTDDVEAPTVSFWVTVTGPLGVTEQTFGMETRCNQGEVAARKCDVIRRLPGST